MPSLSYVICTAPRTGSTLLSEALRSTGRAGNPNEFFDIYDYNERFWCRTLGISNDAEYFAKVVAAATTPNGVFGLKLLWHQSPALLQKLKAAPPGAPTGDKAAADKAADSLHELLQARLGAPRYIWLRRKNKLAQAISYYRASKTGLWRSVDAPNGHSEIADAELPFDFAAISQYLRTVQSFDLQWQAYFRRHRQRVLMILYENLVQRYEPSVHSVFEFLGIPGDGTVIAPPRLERQADRRSEEWEARYLEMARARAGGAAAPQPAAAAAPAEIPAKRVRPRAAAPAGPALPLIAYSLMPQGPPLVTAAPSRDWMDATTQRFAYRCLPMLIANQAGWLILNRHKLVVTWNGSAEPAALKIDFLTGENPRQAVSIFGSGVLTFMAGYLFRTPPGYNLSVRGPANAPKDGIAALEGIVEADWTEATFTMNWKVTRTNHPIVFEEGEPIAMISPLRRGEIERFRPEIRDLSENSELEALHREWALSRNQHNADLRVPDSAARKAGWQRHYVRGTSIRKQPAPEHQTSLDLADFADRRR